MSETEGPHLLDLLSAARAEGYRFVTVTPDSHRRVIERDPERRARDLRDVFGWNLPFAETLLPARFRVPLEQSGMIERVDGGWKSRVRIASVGEDLFLHSAYPTEDKDSVFLGPDTYRFVGLLESELPALAPVGRLVDIGAGAGVGGILAARLAGAPGATLTDVNAAALRLARINARHAGVPVEALCGSGLDPVEGGIDLVIANPPFVMDEAKRAYRDGGDMHGAGLSLAWAVAAAERIRPGGAVILYTGSPILAGEDRLRTALEARMAALGCATRYRELDPDIFGELLSEPAYREVERVAAVGAVIRKPASL